VGKRADEALLLVSRHPRVSPKDRFAAPVWQARRGILQRHCTRQPCTLVGGHVRRHAQTADGGATGHVVDHEHTVEPEALLVHVDGLRGAEVIRERQVASHAASALIPRSCTA
jgi:hypothetical protein